MDGLNKKSRAPRDEFSDLMLEGLILWRVTTPGQSDLWCMLFKVPEGFYFVVDDDPLGTKPYKVHEHHPDVVSLLDRAQALKRSLLKSGWTDIDVE